MCFEKEIVRKIECPHLKSCRGGDLCSVVMQQIRNIADADIRFCTGRHYEACYLYFGAIRQKSATRSFMPNTF